MKYIHNQTENNIFFSKEEVYKIFEINDEMAIDGEEFIKDFAENYSELLNNKWEKFQRKYPTIKQIGLEVLEQLLIKKTEVIRSEILSKYLLSEHLHVLMSNGCSIYAGSKAINQTDESKCKTLLRNAQFQDEPQITDIIQKLVDEKPEVALDRLYEIKMYCANVLKKELSSNWIDDFIIQYKNSFIEEFVNTIDYRKNYLHKLFLKRILARSIKLKRVNLFTLNYDLLIEKSAEEMGISLNNGFSGFHYRVFMPSIFHQDFHINSPDGIKAQTKSMNLFKLHGSLSWRFDDSKPPYGITEQQYDFAENGEMKTILPECIIYPVQSKKKHSLDLPYSEMFRQFIEFVNKPSSTLLIMGYSFLDEHVNDIITNALTNPSFNMIVFSYLDENSPHISEYQKRLFERSREDSRIIIFSGNILGNFEYIVKFLIPYADDTNFDAVLFNTYKNLKGDHSHVK